MQMQDFYMIGCLIFEFVVKKPAVKGSEEFDNTILCFQQAKFTGLTELEVYSHLLSEFMYLCLVGLPEKRYEMKVV